MVDLERWEALVKELTPGIDESQMSETITVAAKAMAENPDKGLTMPGLIRTLCGIHTLLIVLAERKISPHQQSVILGT